MVRRSTVDRSPQSDVYDADYAAGTGDLAPGGGKKGRTSPGWRGAGGRWLVWVFRIVVWAVLLLIGYRGVTAIMFGETGNNPAPAPTASPSSGFPSALASAYALQFGQVYLNADPATASQRASELATFLPAGTDPQLGWNGSGSLQLQTEQVANVAVTDAHHALVTLLARVNGQLMELGVPIYYSGGALAVSGQGLAACAGEGIGAHAVRAYLRCVHPVGADEPAARLLPGLCQRRPGHDRPLPGPGHAGDRPGRRADLRITDLGHRPDRRGYPSYGRHGAMACPGTSQSGPHGRQCVFARRAGDELRTDDREKERDLVHQRYRPVAPARGVVVTITSQAAEPPAPLQVLTPE